MAEVLDFLFSEQTEGVGEECFLCGEEIERSEPLEIIDTNGEYKHRICWAEEEIDRFFY